MDDQPNQAIPPAGGDGAGQLPGQEQPDGGAASQTITVEGVQYTPDQVKDLAKAKADYDRLQPEFTQRSQILSDPNKLREYAKSKFPDIFNPQAPATPETPEKEQMRQAFDLLQKEGNFVTRDALDKWYEEKRQLDTMTESFRKERVDLAKTWDGKDGKPKFDFEAVKGFMLENGYPDLTSSFEKLNREALLEWEVSQRSGRKPRNPVIAAPGGTGPVPTGKDTPIDLQKSGSVKDDFMGYMANRGNE